jgi:polyferredoxin
MCFGLHKDPQAATSATAACCIARAATIPVGGVPWHKAECLMCMNCVGACPQDGLEFRFFRKEKEVASPDLGGANADRAWRPARRRFR